MHIVAHGEIDDAISPRANEASGSTQSSLIGPPVSSSFTECCREEVSRRLKVFWPLSGCSQRRLKFRLLFIAIPMMAWGQIPSSQTPASHNPAITSPIPPNMQSEQTAPYNSSQNISSSSSFSEDSDKARKELNICHVYEVKSLPGSHHFASDFIETMASDPKDPNAVWGLTADLSDSVPAHDRAMYISKSTNGGQTWTQVARVESKYFDANIAEGLRNGLSVSRDGTDFVITTQEGAFQVLPQSEGSATAVIPIAGPRIPHPLPRLSIPKREGDPVRASVVKMTSDGRQMIVGYGYFDLNPLLITYLRDDRGSWIKNGTLPHLPTDLDIFSMEFNALNKPHPDYLYVGTGDQAYGLNFRTMKWTRVAGVGPDSAIHGMTTVGGLHLAACWGIYEPIGAGTVKRVTDARFLLHRAKDQVGPNIRAYGIEVDPARHNREVLTAITGVYTSKDGGKNWKRLNDLPEGEFHSAHFNSDGTVIVSGFVGTFLANPFSNACSPHLKTRNQ